LGGSVGEALGMSRRTIHRDLELFRLLIEPFPALIEPWQSTR
jgi:transcriptional antiterminator